MNFSETAYRVLLRAYPLSYRDRYAEPMEQLFRDRLREVRTFAGLAVLWARTLADWAVSVPARHWERVTSHGSFRSFGQPARRCVFFASYEATSFSRSEITLEDLLLGIRQEPSLVPDAAREAMVRAIEANETAMRRRAAIAKDLRLGWTTKRVLEAASEIAHIAGRPDIAPRDLLDGILRQPDTLAARLLREYSPDPS
jgi:hypothetical protein